MSNPTSICVSAPLLSIVCLLLLIVGVVVYSVIKFERFQHKHKLACLRRDLRSQKVLLWRIPLLHKSTPPIIENTVSQPVMIFDVPKNRN